MKPVTSNAKPMRKFIVFHRGTRRTIGESSAVSPEKAITNIWWKQIKMCNPMTITSIRPSDLDAVEIE